jgi:hypothetical protein
MAPSELTIVVTVHQRSLMGRLRRIPFVFMGHYRTSRRGGNSVLLSLRVAWIFSGLILTFNGAPKKA